MKTIEVKKGQILQRKGDTNTKVYFVESGLLRSYAIDEKGKEHIYMFASEGWIMTDNIAPNKPAALYIDAIENTIAVQETKEMVSGHDGQKLIARVGVLQERIILLMSASALDRYDHFVETYPDIVRRVPQKMIASYLGITPEALSAAKGMRFKK
ncbi:MAG: CRP-like cAMP-binding protein [Marinoscillum sp.]